MFNFNSVGICLNPQTRTLKRFGCEISIKTAEKEGVWGFGLDVSHNNSQRGIGGFGFGVSVSCLEYKTQQEAFVAAEKTARSMLGLPDSVQFELF